jgi:hypothetical protein
MKAITDIGQAEIRAGGRRIFLNPSFLAMSRIGAPEEIVTAFVTVHGGHYPEHRISDVEVMRSIQARCFADMVVTAAKVVQAACDDDLRQVIGVCSVTPKASYRIAPACCRYHTSSSWLAILFAMGWWVTSRRKPPAKVRASTRGNSMPGLSFIWRWHTWGMSESDAWNMTMTSFRAAMNAKYPPKEATKIPTEQHYDEAMDWAEKMFALDAQRNGLH